MGQRDRLDIDLAEAREENEQLHTALSAAEGEIAQQAAILEEAVLERDEMRSELTEAREAADGHSERMHTLEGELEALSVRSQKNACSNP